MNFKSISILAAGLLAAAPAFSAPVVVDFEGLTNGAYIRDFYNGGTDSLGASGPNLGITFGDFAMPFANDPSFPPSFDGDPSLGTTVMTPVGADAALNYATGFGYQVAFKYSVAVDTVVSVWDGLNGQGNMLGSVTLLANSQGNSPETSCDSTAFCFWELGTINFEGIARSVQFGSEIAPQAGFDNITLSEVPLPAAGWLLMSALGGLGTMVRRKRAA